LIAQTGWLLKIGVTFCIFYQKSKVTQGSTTTPSALLFDRRIISYSGSHPSLSASRGTRRKEGQDRCTVSICVYMRAEDFEYLYQLEADYWWFVAMRQITDSIVQLQKKPLRLLDAGCGTGYQLQHYEKQGHDVFGFDLATEAVAGVQKRGFPKVAQASVTEIPFQSESFDVVFSFDVLVQMPVEMSNKGMQEMYRVLKPGGVLFVRAAAYQWLWCSHDKEIHTVHRYNLGELQERLIQTGFKVDYATYANTFLFPIVAAKRLLKRCGIGGGTDVKPLPAGLAWIDPIFRTILSAESWFTARRIRLPFGLSAICYLKKPLTPSITR
jgi:SAM-dependent methyltransferase